MVIAPSCNALSGSYSLYSPKPTWMIQPMGRMFLQNEQFVLHGDRGSHEHQPCEGLAVFATYLIVLRARNREKPKKQPTISTSYSTNQGFHLRPQNPCNLHICRTANVEILSPRGFQYEIATNPVEESSSWGSQPVKSPGFCTPRVPEVPCNVLKTSRGTSTVLSC